MAYSQYTLGRMETRLLTSPEDLQLYGSWVTPHPEGSLWQSPEWKTYQEALGRQVRIYAAMDGDRIVASALVVIDRTSFGLSTWEIPRGPLTMTDGELRMTNLLERIINDARNDRALSVFLSPTHTIPHSSFVIRHSERLVMPEATRIIDLTLSEEDLLTQMKPKGRYNIRLAEKHGVRVVQSDDVGAYARLAKETWARDGFRGPRLGYERFLKDVPGSFLLLAFPPSSPSPSLPSPRPIAGLLGVTWGTHGIYYYGASGNAHRELMAPYLLQWEAIKRCKARGCTSYDLFGIAPEGQPDHPWAGVSDFKAKFGGSVINYPREQEVILRPTAKRLLAIKRKILG